MVKQRGYETGEGWPGPLGGSLDVAQPLPDVASDRTLATPPGRPLRIGLIADTHLTERGLPLPAAVIRLLEGSDYILRAGDIACEPVLEGLRGVATVLSVRGNGDPAPWSTELPVWIALRIGAWRLVLFHDAGHREGGAT